MEIRNNCIYAATDCKVREIPNGFWSRALPLLGKTIKDFEEKTIEEIENPPVSPVVLREQYELAVFNKVREVYSEAQEDAIKTKAMSAMYTYLDSGDLLAFEKTDTENFRIFKQYVRKCKEEVHLEVYNEPHP